MTKNSSSKKIAPSILSANFAQLGDEVRAVEKAGADWIHVDVMDGHFVPNLTIGPVVVDSLKHVTKLPLDVHLMIENPEKYIGEFAKAGATSLTVHHETCPDLAGTVAKIKALGVGAGVSINPATDISVLDKVLPLVDLVLVMTVNPGFGGQKFMSECVSKISYLKDARAKKNLKFLIEVDGGLNESTVAEVSKAGCDVFVAGSAIFKAKNYKDAIEGLRKKI